MEALLFIQPLYVSCRVIQDERSIFWEVTVSVNVRKVHTNMWMITEVEMFESANTKAL
jgi:hypothetical protein